MKSTYRRVRMDQAFIRRNPTMTDGIALADRDLPVQRPPGGVVPRIRPIRIERLKAMGPPYTDQDQARLLYDELGSVAEVARRMGRSEHWVSQACAWDIEQRRSAS